MNERNKKTVKFHFAKKWKDKIFLIFYTYNFAPSSINFSRKENGVLFFRRHTKISYKTENVLSCRE